MLTHITADLTLKPITEPSQTARPGREPISQKWVDALFARFARIWPQSWAKTLRVANRDGMADEWAQGLAGLTGNEIAHGIGKARAECQWPPSIAEFRALCLDGANAEQRAFSARVADDAHKALPAKTWAETREIGARACQTLLDELRGA